MTATDQMYHLGSLEQFELGKIHAVKVGGRDVGIIRTPDAIVAIGGRCPHQGAPLCAGRLTGTMLASDPDEYVYGEDGLVIRCPWHGFEFHITDGQSVAHAFRGRIPIYTVEVRDGEVYCDLRRPEQTSKA